MNMRLAMQDSAAIALSPNGQANLFVSCDRENLKSQVQLAMNLQPPQWLLPADPMRFSATPETPRLGRGTNPLRRLAQNHYADECHRAEDRQ